jgi:hypothetical protein
MLSNVAPGAAGDQLTLAAESASRFGLHVAVLHASKWPWARTRPVSMLSDDAGR